MGSARGKVEDIKRGDGAKEANMIGAEAATAEEEKAENIYRGNTFTWTAANDWEKGDPQGCGRTAYF